MEIALIGSHESDAVKISSCRALVSVADLRLFGFGKMPMGQPDQIHRDVEIGFVFYLETTYPASGAQRCGRALFSVRAHS